jgi:hypothetical protein
MTGMNLPLAPITMRSRRSRLELVSPEGMREGISECSERRMKIVGTALRLLSTG